MEPQSTRVLSPKIAQQVNSDRNKRRKYPQLLEMAQDTLTMHAARAGIAPPQVRPARYGLLAAAVGAAALVLHQYLRPMHPRVVRQAWRPATPNHETAAPALP